MDNAHTSSLRPEREKGGDLTDLLVIAVSVLGTLVGVALLAAGLWGCFVCWKILYRRRKCNKRRKPGVEGFPPEQREVVEMEYIPHYSPYQHQLPCSENVNHTGISRSLGLCMSRSEEHLPAVPSPRSWTPSPPYGLAQNHATGAAARNFSHRLQKNAGQVNCKTADSCSSKLKTKGYMQHYIQGNASSYHPGFNTLASDAWSVWPAHSSSSSHHTFRSRRQLPDATDRQTFGKTCHGKQRQTRWRRSTACTKEPDEYSRSKGGSSHLDFHRSNRYDWRSNLEQDTIPPDACSSYRGSPHARHTMPKHSPLHQQSRRLGAVARHRLESFQSPASSDFPECAHKSKPDTHSKCERNVTLEVLKSTREEEQDISLTCFQTYPIPTNSITSTKPRRLWRESCSFRNEALPAGSSWLHRIQTPRHRQMDPPQSTSQLPRRGARYVEQTHEQEVFRRIARKYGFCETCGIERSSKQQHEGGQGDDRLAPGGWDECCVSCSDDPTPSMSWDNLTPEPSPALTDTQPPQTAKGAAASAQTVLLHDNENKAGVGCGNLAPVRGNSYTISCPSAGEG